MAGRRPQTQPESADIGCMRGIPRPYTISLDAPYEKPGESENRRRTGRFRVKGIHASQRRLDAEVLDISATGMRIRIKGKISFGVGDVTSLTVSADDSTVQVNAKVVRVNELGRKDYEVGLDLSGIDPADAQAIRRMAIDSSRSMFRGL